MTDLGKRAFDTAAEIHGVGAAKGHTKEPWVVSPGRNGPLISVDNEFAGSLKGNLIAEAWVSLLDVDLKVANANAGRIVACVNACEGLPDPEAGIDLLANQIASLTVQKNALLKAAGSAMAFVDGTERLRHDDEPVAALRAAIAKAEEKTG